MLFHFDELYFLFEKVELWKHFLVFQIFLNFKINTEIFQAK